MASPRVWPGTPYPLGATWDGRGVNFALFSAHAEKVELCLFDRSGHHEQARIVLPEYTDEVWHAYAGDPFRLILLHPGGASEEVIMGRDHGAGQRVQFTIPAGSPVTAVDVLPDPAIRQELSTVSNWPTVIASSWTLLN